MRLDIDLVTVSSVDFLPGTQTMLDSFLRHNGWFGGSITVLHDDLPRSMQDELVARFPATQCSAPSVDLTQALDMLVTQQPGLTDRVRRFYSLDAFGNGRDCAALFVDSDVLFCGSIEPMLALTGPLVACGDRAQLIGRTRDSISLAEVDDPGGQAVFRSFNAGVMAISPELRTDRSFHALLAELAPCRWKSIATDHTDQAVLNRCFGDRVVLADPAFNRMLGHGSRLPADCTCPVEEARVLHFNGKAKPWRMDEAVRTRTGDPDFAHGLKAWHRAYRSYLAGRTARGGGDT